MNICLEKLKGNHYEIFLFKLLVGERKYCAYNSDNTKETHEMQSKMISD